MTKISVIVPVYNVEKYLRRCLDSLVNQTLKDIEIICINDGSTDKSFEILVEYANKYSQIVLINKINEGQSVARNMGIEKAKGEYIGFVDSDDYVDKDYFEKLYNAAIKTNCDIACAGFRRFKLFKGRIKKDFKKEFLCKDINSKIIADRLPQDNYVWNKIYKRDKWIQLNIKFQEGRFFEDLALVIKILYNMGDMVVVPDTYYHYRRRNGSTVNLSTDKIKSDYKWAISEQKKFAAEHNINMDFNPEILHKVVINILNIPFVKIYHYKRLVKYKLFGFIPFMSKVTK
ncbi:glycosyltransferase [bacterium]|nr:glycosyltransferase [bacterium]